MTTQLEVKTAPAPSTGDVDDEKLKEHRKAAAVGGESRLEPPSSNESEVLSQKTGGQAAPTTEEGGPAFDSAEVGPDARVVVAGKRGKLWQAIVLRRHARKGAPGFFIHYDGRRRAAEDWVPRASVVGFLDVEAAARAREEEGEEEEERLHEPQSMPAVALPPRKKRKAAEPRAHEEKWELRCRELAAFRDAHGHCNVPRNSARPSEYVLGSWVSNQRLARKNGTLAEDRAARLEGLGFAWEVSRGRPSGAAKRALRAGRATRRRAAAAEGTRGASAAVVAARGGESQGGERADDREELASALDLVLNDPRFDRDDVDGFKEDVWEVARRRVRDKERTDEEEDAAPGLSDGERTAAAMEAAGPMRPAGEERTTAELEAASSMCKHGALPERKPAARSRGATPRGLLDRRARGAAQEGTFR